MAKFRSLGIPIIGILFIVFVVWLYYQNVAPSQSEHPERGQQQSSAPMEVQNAKFPEKLMELKLVNVVSGEPAIAEISKLHGKQIDLKDAYMAEYSSASSNPSENVMVWLGVAKDAQKAAELVEQMTYAMRDSKVFEPPMRTQLEQFVFYSTTGLGMNHFYYARENRVYWVAISSTPDKTNQLFREVIHTIN